MDRPKLPPDARPPAPARVTALIARHRLPDVPALLRRLRAELLGPAAR